VLCTGDDFAATDVTVMRPERVPRHEPRPVRKKD